MWWSGRSGVVVVVSGCLNCTLLVVKVLVVVSIYYGSEGVLYNCCSRHCSIGSCRTGEGCARSVGFWRSRVIFCGFGNPGFW